MVAYAFYLIDEIDKAHFLRVLSERRQNPDRITKESVLNFGRTIAGIDADVNKIFFLRVTVDESTGEISWLGKSIRPKEAF